MTAVTKEGRTYYQTKIHVKGNLTVGIYASETEAAIAYNKAADLLKKAEDKTELTSSFLEGLKGAGYVPMIYGDKEWLIKEIDLTRLQAPNYLEGMSPAAYADLYDSVKVSSGVRHYRCE